MALRGAVFAIVEALHLVSDQVLKLTGNDNSRVMRWT
jgi:hypothetical protein